jgi:excisionase family DNA binding protein
METVYPPAPPDGLLNARQAAAYLGCSVDQVRRLVRLRRVRYRKVGKLVRFACADLDELVRTVEPTGRDGAA